jgi:hypothetical protein
MGDTALVYRQKLVSAISEANKHIGRIDVAFSELSRSYSFPISIQGFHGLLQSDIHLAFADQIIYRFSKALDCMGAKLFKSFLLFQGENIDKPFLDILDSLERIDILKVDTWFELREIRNEISHEYDENEEAGRAALNSIFEYKGELKRIVAVLEHAVSPL